MQQQCHQIELYHNLFEFAAQSPLFLQCNPYKNTYFSFTGEKKSYKSIHQLKELLP